MVNVPIALGVLPRVVGVLPVQHRPPRRTQHGVGDGQTLYTTASARLDATFWKPPGVAVALVTDRRADRHRLLAGAARAGQAAAGAAGVPRRLAFLLTTKVWSPQYSLWLVPLIALARPRWRLALVWQFTEIAVWIMTLTLLLGFGRARKRTASRTAG